MLAKKIKFTDYNGEEREQTFYFNLNKSEMAQLELSVDGGFQGFIERIMNSRSVPDIASQFKKIILMSYGEKSADGMAFIKNDPVRGKLSDWFEQTEAFSELYMELLTEEGAGATFIEGVIPAEVLKKAKEESGINPGHAYPDSVAR